jgi:signal transduction histidine kinase
MDRQLEDFAAHLRARREHVLTAWRKAVSEDSALTSAASLPRTRFDDHVPDILEAFAQKLEEWPGSGVAAAEAAQRDAGERHGAHRWQQGYYLPEVAGEWRHLHLVLLDEVERYSRDRSNLQADMLGYVRRSLVTLCAEGVEHSIAEYVRLHQTSAASRVRELEVAVEHLQRMQRQRADIWRQAAHDLRDNVGLVSNATNVLSHPAATEAVRAQSLGGLERGVSSLRALLDDLLSLARLEAGQERLTVAPFDAGDLLTVLCQNAHGLATARGLTLRCEGPAHLPVEGDAVKVQRIAQNLLINALKYTRQGGVTVAWGPLTAQSARQWYIKVVDTGPGVDLSTRAPILRALKAVTDDVAGTGAGSNGAPTAGLSSQASEAAGAGKRDAASAPGEGLGLSIVKQLCELLDATLELDSRPGDGTTVRVLLPLRQIVANAGAELPKMEQAPATPPGGGGMD